MSLNLPDNQYFHRKSPPDEQHTEDKLDVQFIWPEDVWCSGAKINHHKKCTDQSWNPEEQENRNLVDSPFRFVQKQ